METSISKLISLLQSALKKTGRLHDLVVRPLRLLGLPSSTHTTEPPSLPRLEYKEAESIELRLRSEADGGSQ